MSLCQLKPLSNGLGYCPACDPHARRPIPITARRRCYGTPSDPVTWPKPVVDGVGTRLKRVFSMFGIYESATCRCREYARKLDTLGPRWCREHIGEIVEHLVGEANKRRWLRWLPFKRTIATWLVLRVINNVEQSMPKPVIANQPPVIRTRRETKAEVPAFTPGKRHVIHIVFHNGWQDMVRRAKFALGEQFDCHEVASNQRDRISWLVDHAPPGTIVCNHAFSVDVARFMEIVKGNVNKSFIAINHCSLNHAARWPQYFAAECQLLSATGELRNLWYACPDPNVEWKLFGYDRALWWPNPVYIPENREPEIVDPPCVAIVGRDDWMKGFASQVMAMAMIRREIPDVRLVAIINHARPDWYGLELAKSCGIELEMIPWMSPDAWYRFLREEVSLILQCSMAESFNYVSVDAMIHGRPFVGSCSIRHTPQEWFADHSAPRDIARVAVQILGDYNEQSRKARKIGDEVARQQNSAFASMINIVGRVL